MLHHLALILLSLGFVSCAHIHETSETYVLQGRPASVRSAAVSGSFEPTDGSAGLSLSAMVYSAASGKRFGPYEFALFAIGQPDLHRTMVVHSIVFRSATGKRDAVPAGYLSRRIPFSPTLRDGVTQATWHSPGVITLDYATESAAAVEAKITIEDATGRETRTLTLPFDRQKTKSVTFYNVGLELTKQMKHRGVPFKDLEIGANRKDWKP
jgi:hypothetical protein